MHSPQSLLHPHGLSQPFSRRSLLARSAMGLGSLALAGVLQDDQRLALAEVDQVASDVVQSEQDEDDISMASAIGKTS